jgi:hypothetical protein
LEAAVHQHSRLAIGAVVGRVWNGQDQVIDKISLTVEGTWFLPQNPQTEIRLTRDEIGTLAEFVQLRREPVTRKLIALQSPMGPGQKGSFRVRLFTNDIYYDRYNLPLFGLNLWWTRVAGVTVDGDSCFIADYLIRVEGLVMFGVSFPLRLAADELATLKSELRHLQELVKTGRFVIDEEIRDFILDYRITEGGPGA